MWESRDVDLICRYIEHAKKIRKLDGSKYLLWIKGFDHTLGDGFYIVYAGKDLVNPYLIHEATGQFYIQP